VSENRAKRNVDFIVSRYSPTQTGFITTKSKHQFNCQSIIRSFHSRPTIYLLHNVSNLLLAFSSREYVSNSTNSSEIIV